MALHGSFVYDQIFGKKTLSVNNTYIISGGMSYDNLQDNLVSHIDSITYKIDGNTYNYSGGDNIPGIPMNTQTGLCFITPTGLSFGTTVPPNGIVIAQFNTDDTKITSWEPSGSFSLVKISEELTEIIHMFSYLENGGRIYSQRPSPYYNETQRQIYFNENVVIRLFNNKTGPALFNKIEPADFILENNQLSYIVLDRSANSTKTISISNLSDFDLDTSKFILAVNLEGIIYYPGILNKSESYKTIDILLPLLKNSTLFFNTTNSSYSISGDNIWIMPGLFNNNIIEIYLNGLKLVHNKDVVMSSENSIKINHELDPGDVVYIIQR